MKRAIRLSLRLYLDECAYSRRLVRLLRGAPYGHYVETPTDSNLFGRADREHFTYARSHGLIVVTKNPDDFEELHRHQPDHAGILGIYQNNLPTDMSAEDIARAIQNLDDAASPLAGVFQVLNAWNY